MSRLKSLTDVVDWRLCLGCGACAYVCPDRRVTLIDYVNEGIRPRVADGDCRDCTDCLQVCPAVRSDFGADDHVVQSTTGRPADSPAPASAAFDKEWGPIVGLWEGHATQEEIRFRGSSGGALTALAAYCVERAGMHGVLHIGQDPDDPLRNRTRLSRTREHLLAAAGSRYSPASVCNGLHLVESAPAPCAIIGKPAEIAAVRNARRLKPELDHKIGVTLSFFCAESPSTGGTIALLNKLGVDPNEVRNLRYRGFGWPGHFAPTLAGSSEPCQRLTYRESWAFLQAHRPWSVQLWPDSSGEMADISCGDPWYEEPDGKNPGFSLVVARTQRGKEIVEGAIAAGYLELRPAEPWKLVKSQSGLLVKKGSIWGRRIGVRLLGLPVTRLEGADLYHCWRPLKRGEKIKAIFGTLRRVVQRGYYRRQVLNAEHSKPVGSPTEELPGRLPASHS